eukprot:CAMPEP_0170364594 /NCGR_PEP_ID=MMETSP0117_2-20130122/5458_1 /TAXON_ID=400756 /ORGANISM="Durinskia baltica, Strain CSIRO CS-38" /LENGTH=356 /DNA_ID=CAMNT_0010619107 /DNA_START=90 /DNA_END=1160 /DNA_ORIENTATION=+
MTAGIHFLIFCIVVVLSNVVGSVSATYQINVVARPSTTVISNVDNTTSFTLVFNPSWVEGTPSNGFKSGLLMRTQNCSISPGDECAFCGGSAADASILTYGERNEDGSFNFVSDSAVVFGPYDDTDSWGTEDPRIKFNPVDGLYYMFYTAYNGKDIFLSLATTPNPTVSDKWTRHGAVFPDIQNSKSGALLLRSKEQGPHFLFWGDSSIKMATSYDPAHWPADGGSVFIETRADHFDSKLVESGPPPLQLLNGDYVFFYNSATVGWPDEPGSAYHPGWVILDGKDPSVIKQRSEEPLLTPTYAWELGTLPYTCNVPNVIFLEAARRADAKTDTFEVYFGGADAVIGSAIVEVVLNA